MISLFQSRSLQRSEVIATPDHDLCVQFVLVKANVSQTATQAQSQIQTAVPGLSQAERLPFRFRLGVHRPRDCNFSQEDRLVHLTRACNLH